MTYLFFQLKMGREDLKRLLVSLGKLETSMATVVEEISGVRLPKYGSAGASGQKPENPDWYFSFPVLQSQFCLYKWHLQTAICYRKK